MTEAEDMPKRTLHDRIFKEFLHRFLPDFLQIFFPDEAARLNFDTLTFPKQELIVNLPNQTLRITDVVADVATSAGETETIIVHVEVEGRDKQTLPQRMFEYYSLLRLLRQRRVLPLALLLTPQAGGLRWAVYTETLFGHELLTFRYGQVGIRDLHSESYLTDNPVAATLAALMQPTKLHPAEVKLASLQTVIRSRLTEGDKLFLIDVIQTYLPREGLADAGDEIMEALMDTELTWAERMQVEGRREGKIEGKIELLLRLLRARFGELPPDFEQQLRAVDNPDLLDKLSEQVLTAVSLHDIQIPETNGESAHAR